jgi:phosphatidylserine/phosphatidylglycerophosphate/cardiolipin synthase-like enzyme
MVKIQGPAVMDVSMNFVHRWNDDASPALVPYQTSPPKIEQIDGNDVDQSGAGSVAVQVLRTYSCSYGGYKNFAPSGEMSIFAGILKGIKNAQKFIYIEDQYLFYVRETVDALMDALKRGVERIIILGADQTLPGMQTYQHDFIAPLVTAFPDRIHFYHRKGADVNTKVYVHSKVMIVDDRFMIIGSANQNMRSMTSDPEVSVGLVDTTTSTTVDGLNVGSLVFDTRNRLFSDHLGIDVEILKKTPVIDAMKLWESGSNVEKVEKFDPSGSWYWEQAWWNPLGDIVHAGEEANGRCFLQKNKYPLQ